MEEIGAEFIISGEVVGQRPMSQHRPALRTIEKESDLQGKILRPLSGALLPATDPEKEGLIKREDLGMIRGRSRKKQLELAREFAIEDPPNAGGGCLLTDPAFSLRVKDLFNHTETPNTNDIGLLKVGRHFRFDNWVKLIVGRNKDENDLIQSLALPDDYLIQATDYVGPISLLRGKNNAEWLEISAAITLRYSDCPPDMEGLLLMEKNGKKNQLSTKRAEESTYIPYRI